MVAVQLDFAGLAVLAEEQVVDMGHAATSGIHGDAYGEASELVIRQRNAVLGVRKKRGRR